MSKKAVDLPIRKDQCKTCPFRDEQDGGWEDVRPLLIERALNEATPICHSTGDALVRHGGEKLKAHICRGARNVQLGYFHHIGFITEPTDEAWDAKCREMKIK